MPRAQRALRACVVRPPPFLPPLPPWRPGLVWLRVRPRLPEWHVGLVGWLGLRTAWGTASCSVRPGWLGRRGGGGRDRGPAKHVVGGGGRNSGRWGEPGLLGVADQILFGACGLDTDRPRDPASDSGHRAQLFGRGAGKTDVTCHPGQPGGNGPSLGGRVSEPRLGLRRILCSAPRASCLR